MWNGILLYHFRFDIVTAVNVYIMSYSAMDSDLWEESVSLPLQCTKIMIPPSSVYQGPDISLFSVVREE